MVNAEEVKAWKNPEANAFFKYKITMRIAPYAAIWFSVRKESEKGE